MEDVLVARRRAEEHGRRGTLVEEHEVDDQRADGEEPRREEPVGQPPETAAPARRMEAAAMCLSAL